MSEPIEAVDGVDELDELGGGCRVHLHVVPRASETRVVGVHDGRVKLQVAAPPVDGEANAAIVRWLAKALGVGRDTIHIASGATGKKKTVVIAGISASDARKALLGRD